MIQATVAAITVAVLLLGFPLAFFGAQYVHDNELDALAQRTQALARSVDRAQERGEDVPEASLRVAAGDGDNGTPAFVVVVVNGERITYGDEVTGKAERSAVHSDAGALVVLRASYWAVYWQSMRIVLFVIAAAVVAFAAGIAMAVVQANRLSAPLVYLAASAEQLGSGQVRPQVAESGVEEIDLVAAELARTSERLASRMATERQFAADASHQLRTPLTALSMRLEEISLASDDPDVQEEARISLEQVERLVTVVDDLLTRSRRAQGGTTEAIRLREVTRQQDEEWGPVFEREGRRLVVDVPADTYVLATPGGLAQALATLVENSLTHGGGTTTVRSRGSRSGSVVIEVADEGDGVPDDLAGSIFEREVTSGKGTGLGLALARDLVAADGGRLELSQRRPAVFSIFLSGVPHTLDPSVVLPAGATVSSARFRPRRSKRR
ncbi:signal transduction histidine kinase [Luteimicrobium subarcticum]|uniref:Signal transduction histidine-protein kinase/phosphatase MprB n=2 Tax=Luteimicrobium subarcticum TaxID=620910 RepID=A0A2M8WTE6_9MICO|nr:signal transduction histidine kinase [Luteimicrobium subarcticum]